MEKKNAKNEKVTNEVTETVTAESVKVEKTDKCDCKAVYLLKKLAQCL